MEIMHCFPPASQFGRSFYSRHLRPRKSFDRVEYMFAMLWGGAHEYQYTYRFDPRNVLHFNILNSTLTLLCANNLLTCALLVIATSVLVAFVPWMP